MVCGDRGRWLAMVVVLAMVLPGCGRTARRSPYPHESIMTVVLELKLFLDQDPYRNPPGTDLEDRNIYRVSLARLTALEELADPVYADVLAYARAQCLERLGLYGEASGAFEAAEALRTELARDALERAGHARSLAELIDRSRLDDSVEGYLNGLEVIERRLEEWIDRRPPFPYPSLARIERERAQEERARLLAANRFLLRDAAPRAAEAFERLVDLNPDSARRNRNRLLVGEFYETLARDTTASLRPEGPAFNPEGNWADWVARARHEYRLVAQADGDPAKLEGQARLRSLDAYALAVRSLAR